MFLFASCSLRRYSLLFKWERVPMLFNISVICYVRVLTNWLLCYEVINWLATISYRLCLNAMNAWNSMCHPEVSKKERMVWIASSKIKLLKQRTIYSPTGLSYPTKECAKANILELLSKMSVRKNFATQFHPSTVAMMFGIHFQNNVHLGKTLSAWIETVFGRMFQWFSKLN